MPAGRADRLLLRTAVAALARFGRGELADAPHVVGREVDPDAAPESARQHHRAVADADQPADRQPDGVEQLPHLAVAAFGDDDAIPAVGAVAAALLDRLEGRGLAVDGDAGEQALAAFLVEQAEHAHRVLALDAEARMHQLVGQFARVGEQQQAFGIDVEPADRQPLAVRQPRQAAEHRRPLLRIVVRDDFAGRLVVGHHPRRRRRDAELDRLAVDGDAVAKRDALADVRAFAVDGDRALLDEVFHVAPRTDAGLRQHLLQLRRVGVGGEHALAGAFDGAWCIVAVGLRIGIGFGIGVVACCRRGGSRIDGIGSGIG